MSKPWENVEGYQDPTAYQTILKEDELENDVNTLIRIIKNTAKLSGFEILNRIEIRHKKSGRVFR